MKKETIVLIAGKELVLTNLDKVLWPAADFTKAHVIDYYRRISPFLLPHLRDRALTLKRYPDGVEGPFFYEKNCPDHAPEWIRRAPVFSETRGGAIHFCVVDDLPSLIWVGNLASLELHTYLSKVKDPLKPTMMVFDLDPGPGTDIVDCADIALMLHATLDGIGLKSFAKTSGSKGMQVYVPFNTPTSYDQTKALSRTLAEVLERDRPDAVTTNMRKAEREERVFIDWSQNDDHKTTVCVYSLRAKEFPTVSTPLLWNEVAALAEGDRSLAGLLADEVVARAEKLGDPFEPVLTLRQKMPDLV